MALPSSGAQEYTPGQAPQPVGVWRHRLTGQTLTVEHPAAADALASFKERDERGNYQNTWDYVGEAEESAAEAQAKTLADSQNEFSVTTTSRGQKQYRKNGRMISKAQYDKEAPQE